jgi:hypothetical protein
LARHPAPRAGWNRDLRVDTAAAPPKPKPGFWDGLFGDENMCCGNRKKEGQAA